MLNVNTINAKNSQRFEVKPGQPTSIKVEPNTRFELADAATGKAPIQIKARRAGDNLEIVVDEKALVEEEATSNAQSPDLVLENYYKQADVSLFAGAGEEAVSYVPVDGAASSSYAAMNTSATTGAALGVLPLLNPLLGVAVVGAGAVVATTGNDTGTSNQIPVAQDAATKVTENKVVSDKVPTATDADGTVASYRLVSDVAAGKLTFNADGSYSFEANKDFDSLADGQTKTVSFTYSAVDNAGGVSEPKTVTITVTGTNDAPVAAVATKSVAEGKTVEDAVTATDTDEGAKLAYALVSVAPEGLIFNADGTYTFDANNEAYNSLKAGETKDLMVKFKANDGTVDSADQTLTITVTGTNDAPVIQLTGNDLDQATLTESNKVLSTSGTLTVTDPDDTDSIVSFAVIDVQLDPAVPSFLTPEQFASGQSALKSFLTLSAVGTMADLHNLKWTFDSAYDYNLDLIPEGAALALKYTIEVKDTAGTTTSHVVTVKIDGTNDGPAIQVQSGDTDRADLTETNSALSASGTVSLFDMDLTDEVNYVVSDVALNTTVTPFLSADDFAIIKEQVKGFMTLDAIGYVNDVHNLQWTFDSTGDSHAGFIPVGQTLALDYTVTATDKSGAMATQVIHINILGTNATPLIEFKGTDSAAESLIETDDVLSTTGTMSLTDLDFNDPANATRISVKVNGHDGGLGNDHFLSMLKLSTETNSSGKPLLVNDSHNVRWSFESFAKYDFDYLAKDEVLNLEYTIEVKDSVGATSQQVVAVSITGTNDAPLIFKDIETDTSEGTVDSAFKASGTLTVIDEDLLTAKVASVKLFKGADSSAAEIDVLGLNLEDLLQTSGSFADTNELHNLTWSFVGDASKADGLTSGAYTLAYDIAISDKELTSHQTVNIHFQV